MAAAATASKPNASTAIDDARATAEAKKTEGNACFASRDYARATALYREGISQLEAALPTGKAARSSELLAALWANTAQCQLALEDNWKALFAANVALAVLPEPAPSRLAARAHYRMGDAAARIGFLSVACEQLEASHARSPGAETVALLTAVRRRLVTTRGRGTARREGCEAELAVLARTVGDWRAEQTAAGQRRRWVESQLRSAEGRGALVRYGLLDSGLCDGDEDTATLLAAATHTGLMHELKKIFQVGTSSAVREALGAPPSGCVAPASLVVDGAAAPLGPTGAQELGRSRLVVVDDALPSAMVEAAAAEVRGMMAEGLLTGDADDTCNPGSLSAQLELWDDGTASELARRRPALLACVRALEQLPQLLATQLGLELRVPQSVLLAAYPPGAQYRRHFDSYNGKDNPRVVTALLYLAWEPRKGGELRTYAVGGGGGGTEGDTFLTEGDGGRHRDIDPNPGRLVLFMSQEVEHAVLPSVGERFALTLWIWDVKKDELGR